MEKEKFESILKERNILTTQESFNSWVSHVAKYKIKNPEEALIILANKVAEKVCVTSAPRKH